MHLLLIALSFTLAADGGTKTPAASGSGSAGSSASMKSMLKDATAGSGNSDGGTPAGPDVDKMPFTPDSIKQVMAFYAPQIQSCYEETLAAKDKKLEGKLVTAFTITPEGSVAKPSISKKGTTLKEPKLHDCVVALLSTISFPKPTDKKNHPIEYPFNLKAVQ